MKNNDDKPDKPKLSLVKSRMNKAYTAISLGPPKEIAYQHTVLCQTSLPYRNPGKDVREWKHRNGNIYLLVLGGNALDPVKEDFVDLPLPSGPKARLILCYLNGEAMKHQSPVIEVGDSLTAFVRRLQRRAPNGPEIRKFKDQLSASTIRLGFIREDRAVTIKQDIVQGFDLWVPKDEAQRVLWSSEIRLSDAYFESLMAHAVLLDERAVAALSHSSMALDIYCWLAQRLHRIPKGKPQFIPWTTLKDQFGQGVVRMNHFKANFRLAMGQVLTQYPCARVEGDGRGLTLRNSLPPVPEVRFILPKPGK